MTRSLLLVASSGLNDESCQDLDGEVGVFLVEGFPGIGLVEEKIEEASIFFLHWRSPWLWLKFRLRWSRERDGRGEHRRELVCAASLPGSRDLLRAVHKWALWAKQPGRSNQQESRICCHRARSAREGADLCDASPRKPWASGLRTDGEHGQ